MSCKIKDVNGDDVNDLLYKRFKAFQPSWGNSIVEEGLISEFLTLDAKSGKIIWEFNVPFSQYYERLRDVLNIGDINDDYIDDYAVWIIPSEIPQEVSNLIKIISSTPSLNLYDKEREEAIYGSLLSEFSKLIIINGSNGKITWDTPLIEFPYRFYREFGNLGYYTDPKGLYSLGGDYRNYIVLLKVQKILRK